MRAESFWKYDSILREFSYRSGVTLDFGAAAALQGPTPYGEQGGVSELGSHQMSRRSPCAAPWLLCSRLQAGLAAGAPQLSELTSSEAPALHPPS